MGQRKVSKKALLGIIDQLQTALLKLDQPAREAQGARWEEYYTESNYSSTAFIQKQAIIRDILKCVSPSSVWDLGANTGFFARLASQRGIDTLALDFHAEAVEVGYLESRAKKDEHLLHLVMDVTNPSPAIGWANTERMSLMERGPVNLVMALALIHHLRIANNLPLDKIVNFLAQICDDLIIEFIPIQDSQLQRMLAVRTDIFHDYSEGNFEHEFCRRFKILRKIPLSESHRTVYYMSCRSKSSSRIGKEL